MNDHDEQDERLRAALQVWPAPEADAVMQAALLHQLTPLLRRQRLRALRGRAEYGWALLRAQLYIVQADVWLGTVVVLGLGLLVTLAIHRPGQAVSSLPFVLIAPLLTALTVSLLYGTAETQATELEATTPTTRQLILLARLMLIFGFNLGAASIGSAALSLAGVSASSGELVGAWLAPMTFLSALAFTSGILFSQPTLSALVSPLIWVTQVLRQVVNPAEAAFTRLIPDIMQPEAHPALWVAALVMVVLATWWAGQEAYCLTRIRMSS